MWIGFGGVHEDEDMVAAAALAVDWDEAGIVPHHCRRRNGRMMPLHLLMARQLQAVLMLRGRRTEDLRAEMVTVYVIQIVTERVGKCRFHL